LLQSNEELWAETSQRLTDEVQQIIEFAKFVPGFISLPQDDQIMLLKGGTTSTTTTTAATTTTTTTTITMSYHDTKMLPVALMSFASFPKYAFCYYVELCLLFKFKFVELT